MISWSSLVLVLFVTFVWLQQVLGFDLEGGGGSRRRLNEFISHFEVLDYRPTSRVKREVMTSSNYTSHLPPTEPKAIIQKLHFQAHGQNFHIILQDDGDDLSGEDPGQGGHLTSSFSPKFYIEQWDPTQGRLTQEQGQPSHLVHGYLEDDPGSRVYGSIVNGIFDGWIRTGCSGETFYIERAHKYFGPDQPEVKVKGHSIIYSGKDVDHNPEGHSGPNRGCGLNQNILDWMTKVQSSAVDLEKYHHHNDHDLDHFEGQCPKSTTSASAGSSFTSELLRTKREIHIGNSPDSRTTCNMYIRTDPILWTYISKQEGTSERLRVKEEILSIINEHVRALNDIFTNTFFQGQNTTYRNIRFVVQATKIDTPEECNPGFSGDKNPFCEENIDVSNFLNLHSLTNAEHFCLSYLFTARDFLGGVVGLAWVASSSASPGGICDTYREYYDEDNDAIKIFNNHNRSLNTGIITFINYNRRLPPKISHLTFSHEVGHNFGAPHDSERCQPGGKSGNFLMYSSATSGYLPNNDLFSPCSIQSISSVLDNIFLKRKKRNCFIATDGAFCGNQIVEEGEECDCGYNTEECEEKCCFPKRVEVLDGPRGQGQGPTNNGSSQQPQGCKRTPGSACSPSEGLCCEASTCSFVQGQTQKLCHRETECSQGSFCSGSSPKCPHPLPKPNLTECNKGTQVCVDGECSGSICTKYSLDSCYLSSTDYSDKRTLCQLACLEASTGKCAPTADLGIQGLVGGLSLGPGAPCDNFRGFCDTFRKCRAIDEEGPLFRLRRLYLNKMVAKNLYLWAVDHWVLVTLGLILFIVLMTLFIKCCAVHTPSSNPHMPRALKFSETLRRPVKTLRTQMTLPRRNPGGYETTRTREPPFPL